MSIDVTIILHHLFRIILLSLNLISFFSNFFLLNFDFDFCSPYHSISRAMSEKRKVVFPGPVFQANKNSSIDQLEVFSVYQFPASHLYFDSQEFNDVLHYPLTLQFDYSSSLKYLAD